MNLFSHSDFAKNAIRHQTPQTLCALVTGVYYAYFLGLLLAPQHPTPPAARAALPVSAEQRLLPVEGTAAAAVMPRAAIDFKAPPVLAQSVLRQQQHNASPGEPQRDTARVAEQTLYTGAGQTPVTPHINFSALTEHSANGLVLSNRFSGSLMPTAAFATSVTELPPVQRDDWLAFAPKNSTPEGLRVVLDPGHGGSDPGTVGPTGQTEKVLTLAIARRVQTLLHQRSNVQVSLTRSSDEGLSRQHRLNNVAQTHGDLLVSLHLNNLPQENLTLVESFYAGPENILESILHTGAYDIRSKPTKAEKASVGTNSSHRVTPVTTASLHKLADASRRLSGIIQDRVFDTVKAHNPRAINAGVKTDTLYMLTRSNMPAALIELTCLSNSDENRRLDTADYREELAEAIARGIIDYFHQPQNGLEI